MTPLTSCLPFPSSRLPLALNTIRTFAGTGYGSYGGDGGQANAAELYAPQGLAVDGYTGNVYIVDRLNSCIRMVSKSGIITTVAGTGKSTGYSGDGGPATSSLLNFPDGVSLDTNAGVMYMYISDTSNHRIRMVRTGIITTIAGNGAIGFSGDGGPAIAASLSSPSKTAIDPLSRNVYIADSGNARIRMVAVKNGFISTVVGNGQFGYTGDGGPATSAALGYPSGLAVDTSGNLYISDILENCVRMMKKSTGIITTVAGTGVFGYSGDGGLATIAKLKGPAGIAVDAISGDLFIAGAGSNRIRKVMKSTGFISTVAGNGQFRYTGDGGPAINATFCGPGSVALDASSGMMFIADVDNNVVRAVNMGVTASSAPSASPVPTPTPSFLPTTFYPTNNFSQLYQPTGTPTKFGEIRIVSFTSARSNPRLTVFQFKSPYPTPPCIEYNPQLHSLRRCTRLISGSNYHHSGRFECCRVLGGWWRCFSSSSILSCWCCH
jgi:trimeric autotransporter adhesin